MAYAAIMGHGVVGSGVAELLVDNASVIKKRTGEDIRLKYVLDLLDFPGLPYSGLFTKNFDDILAVPEISVVAEVMGGINPAYSFTKRCLEAGKSVVTSNKELVAAKGTELLAIAAENNVNYMFEASVGGGIPIIRPLYRCLAANEIELIAGILNGTTNFILTKMIREGLSFAAALEMARKLGYAEADPTSDIEGVDACRKICILASLAYGYHIDSSEIVTEGITGITPEDVRCAAAAGCVIKLIGRAYRSGGKVFAMVSPALIPETSQLAGIDDVFNGILVRGDAVSDVVFYGKGAGKLPTASAVVGDIIDCVKEKGKVGGLMWREGGSVADYKNEPAVMCVRCTGKDVEKTASALFGYIETLSVKDQPVEEFAFLTPELPEGVIKEKIAEMRANGIAIISSIRKLDY